MKIATWNVNSIRARIDRVLAVLERHDLDVLAIQELKCKSEQFPAQPFIQAGYEVAAHGLNQWNGVAIISRVGLDDVRHSFPEQPGFSKDEQQTDPPLEARAVGACVGGMELWSVYVPNGRSVNDPHYRYKLDFLAKLRDYAASVVTAHPDAQLAIVGDWNVIPTDADVWDTDATPDHLYMTPSERKAFFAFEDSGFTEVTRAHATNYTFWDYQRLHFPRNEGMRIDYVYASPALAQRVHTAQIDRDERKGKGASDHVPVIVEIG
ncbi:MAG: exodeoxyribonuclease III [Actinomycetaceae bacterium]|nr:exodeoxyribonuclease III [Arcanobacterium sp.]MDD7687139.1 exodeoxyribonuclease III [Actinomycetaceae bacterium]MDY5273196.1 exodeoxyribonuclease III [Arcanobacterium sp.]